MPSRPNFIVVVSDTFRRDHVGAYGNPAIKTPNLDRFASEAALCEWHFGSSFPTMPARIDFTTGRFGATFMGWEPLPSDIPTLAESMSAADYVTMGIVDTPFFVRNGYGYDRGFEDFMWVRGQGDHTRPLERSDFRSTWRREEDRCAPQTFMQAEHWLERHHDQPFFLYVDTWDPHEPWDAPDFYTKLYLEDFDGAEVYPPYGDWKAANLSERDLEIAHATYCGEVTMVDRWFGSLLEKVRVLGLTETTYVVFVSDHGFYFGEHGCLGKGFFASEEESFGPLGEIGGAPSWARSPLYPELARLPLIVRGPDVKPSRISAITSNIDIVPTVLDLAGVQAPLGIHGISAAAVLRGETAEHRTSAVTAWPLYLKRGSITAAVDSAPRRILEGMPISVSNRTHSAVFGGEAPPELLVLDGSGDGSNVWSESSAEGKRLAAEGIDSLESLGVGNDITDALRASTLL